MEERLIENDSAKITESLTATVLEHVDGAEIPEATEAQCVEGVRLNNVPSSRDEDLQCRNNIRCLFTGCCIGVIFGIGCVPPY